MVTKINKTLELHSPETLVKILETFVAILRNNQFTKPVDVELFFADNLKLAFKMRNMQTTQVDLDLAMAAKEKLDPIIKQDDLGMEDGIDISEFRCFADWSVSFCDAAIVDLRVQKTKQEQEELEKEKARAEKLVQRFDQIERDCVDERFETFFDEAKQNLQERQEILNDVAELDRTQAEDAQRKLNKFENNYFTKLMQEIQNSADAM